MPRNPSCSRCPLSETANHVCVWGDGPKRAKIMLLGEAPGEAEDKSGKPFQGSAGRELDEALADVGLKRKDIYIANPVKCRPPNNRDPLDSEIAACFPYLAEEISKVQPSVIICLGKGATYAMTGKRVIIKDERGRPLPSARHVRVPDDCTILTTYHPAAFLHSRDPMQRKALREDLAYAKNLAGVDGSRPEHKVRHVFEGEPVKPALALLKDAKRVAVDCEWTAGRTRDDMKWPWTPGAELYSVSISGRVGDSIQSVAFQWPAGSDANALRRNRRSNTLKRIQSFLDGRELIFHNGPSDLIWLLGVGFENLRPAGDTMFLAYLINEEQRLNLDRLAALTCGIPEWKSPLWHRRPSTSNKRAWTELLDYNALDTYATLLLHDGLVEQVKAKSAEERENIRKAYYELLLPAIPAFALAALRGVEIDVKALKADIKLRRENRDRLLSEITKELPDGASERFAGQLVRSPELLKSFLSSAYMLDVEDTQAETLKPYGDQYPVIGKIADVKHENKMLGTYEEPWERLVSRHERPRLRSVYNIAKTRTGRAIASLEEGGSILVAPREGRIRRLVTARRGFKFGSADYSQAELRMIAWLAPDRRMRELFNEGADLHQATAAFVKGYAERHWSVNEFWKDRHRYMKLVTKDERQKAKGINFGYDFGMQPPKFQIYVRNNYNVEMTLDEAAEAREGYFELYEDLEEWHQRMQGAFYQGVNWCVTPTGRYRRNITSVTQMINTPIQMTANDIALFASHLISDKFEQEYQGVAMFVGFMHDAIMFEVRDGLEEEIRYVVKNIMEHPPLERLGIKELPIPLVADVNIGKGWVE